MPSRPFPIEPVGPKVRALESYTSAEVRYLKPLLPPATRTWPSESSVAVCQSRASTSSRRPGRPLSSRSQLGASGQTDNDHQTDEHPFGREAPVHRPSPPGTHPAGGAGQWARQGPGGQHGEGRVSRSPPDARCASYPRRERSVRRGAGGSRGRAASVRDRPPASPRPSSRGALSAARGAVPETSIVLRSWRRGWGFEPTGREGPAVFKTAPINRSGTSPRCARGGIAGLGAVALIGSAPLDPAG